MVLKLVIYPGLKKYGIIIDVVTNWVILGIRRKL